ncbi:hypothetical protein KM043_010370 [Ampulex compressa]|nr:hypothetical protein KM043_010370 [Ampulex compressa]
MTAHDGGALDQSAAGRVTRLPADSPDFNSAPFPAVRLAGHLCVFPHDIKHNEPPLSSSWPPIAGGSSASAVGFYLPRASSFIFGKHRGTNVGETLREERREDAKLENGGRGQRRPIPARTELWSETEGENEGVQKGRGERAEQREETADAGRITLLWTRNDEQPLVDDEDGDDGDGEDDDDDEDDDDNEDDEEEDEDEDDDQDDEDVSDRADVLFCPTRKHERKLAIPLRNMISPRSGIAPIGRSG